mgnify:CR=1 FL=1
MIRQLTVDFNRVVRDDLIRGNARHAVPGTDLAVGAIVIVGDDDWGAGPAEIVEFDASTGALVLPGLPGSPEGTAGYHVTSWREVSN